MFLDFNKVFNPTTKEEKEHKTFIKKIISEEISKNIEKYGNACSNCKHGKWIETYHAFENYNFDIVCKYDKKIRLDEDEAHDNCCDKYERKII